MDDSGQVEPLGSRVRRLRMERGFGQERLALLARLDQSGLSKFERNVRTLGETSLRRIAAILDVPFEYLPEGTDHMATHRQVLRNRRD